MCFSWLSLFYLGSKIPFLCAQYDHFKLERAACHLPTTNLMRLGFIINSYILKGKLLNDP